MRLLLVSVVGLFCTITILMNSTESKKVTFKDDLEENDSSSSESTDDSSSGSSSSSSSCTSSPVRHLRDTSRSDGKFGNVIIDDDLLIVSKHRRSRKDNEKRKERRLETSKVINSSSSSGFVYSSEWEKEFQVKNPQMTMAEKNGLTLDVTKRSGGVVSDPINAGWLLISFEGGGEGKLSSTIFKFKTGSTGVRVSLVDLFCRGDSFGVLDGPGGKLIAQSSRIQSDRECEEQMFSPDEALKDGRWSSVIFDLPAGDHEIKLKTIDNSMDGGLAAIKFESYLPRRRVSRNDVCRGFNDLVVIKKPVKREEAESVCSSLKMDIAERNLNELAVQKSIDTCIRSGNKNVWSFDSTRKEVSLLSSEKKDIKKPYPVLCIVRP